MGQYGNQPDFGTRAARAPIDGYPSDPTDATNLGSAALYIGTGGTLVCRVVGGNANYWHENDPQSGYTVFEKIPSGSFFPVIVDAIWTGSAPEGDATTCDSIIALY